MTGLIPFAPAVADSLAIGAGAVGGALSRHYIGKFVTEKVRKDSNLKYLIGWHTAGINVLGSFLLGGVFGSPLVDPSISATVPTKKSIAQGLTPRMKLLIGVGFCGSFTTFSTFSVEVVNMISRGETAKAASYIAANNLGGLSAAACGIMVAKKIFHL